MHQRFHSCGVEEKDAAASAAGGIFSGFRVIINGSMVVQNLKDSVLPL